MSESKAPLWPVIPSYKLEDILGRGGMGAVYRGVPLDDRTRRVAIKVIDQTGHIPHEAIVNFQKEASLMGQLYHPNIIYFIDFGRITQPNLQASSYFIAMELARGLTLREYINSAEYNKIDDIAFLIAVGKQLTGALDYTHSRGIIHRDIKPQNIMIELHGDKFTDMTLKLLDFGVASLSEASQSLGLGRTTGIDDFAGTPLYQAPEQSGLTNWISDHRVDLYSIGCLFFEILTRKPPYSAATKQELRKKHLESPVPQVRLLRPDVPLHLENIISKCLAKNPLDRYSSAFSLLCDLITLEAIQTTNFQPFSLGSYDQCNANLASIKLVGRDAELKALIDFYTALETETRSRISIITGPRGSGKSRLVKEFRKCLNIKKVRFVSGIFTRYNADLSFNSLALAFDDYLIKIKRELPDEANLLKEKFNNILGDSLPELCRVIPGLKEYAETPQDDLNKLENRENLAFLAKNFLDFTSCLMTRDQPLVCIFEDLHLADHESLKLIDSFITNANTERIYLVLSYLQQDQDSELKSEEFTNELHDFLEKIKKLKRRAQFISLAPISTENTTELIGELIQGKNVAPAYVDWINHHFDGNAMHILETTKTLIMQKKFVPKKENWTVDLDSIAASDFRNNSADLDLANILRYPESHRWAIQFAAMIGSKFQRDHLIVSGYTNDKIVAEAISMAQKDKIFVESKKTDPSSNTNFEFLHLGVQELLVHQIPTHAKRSAYLQLAKDLFNNSTDNFICYRAANLFNIALSKETLISTDEKKIALASNLKAARLAVSVKDDEFALDFLKKAIAIYLNPEEEPEKFTEIMLEKINILMKTKTNLAEVKQILKKITSFNITPASRARCMDLLFEVYFLIGNGPVALQIARRMSNHTKAAKQSWKTKIKVGVNLIADLLYAYKIKLKPSSLNRLISREKPTATSTYLLSAYNKAQLSGFISNNYDLSVNLQAAEIVISGLPSEEGIVDFLLNRIKLLQHFGFEKAAINIFIELYNLRKNLNVASAARIELSKNLLFDAVSLTFSETLHQKSRFYPFIKGPDKNLVESSHRALVAWHLFCKGQVIRAKDESILALEQIPYSNPSSSFIFFIFCTSSILLGERKDLIEKHQRWSSIRKKEHPQHTKDLFKKICDTLVCVIKSEITVALSNYRTIADFSTNLKARGLLTQVEKSGYELFLVLFPMFAQLEFGAQIETHKQTNQRFPFTSFMINMGEILNFIYPKKSLKTFRKIDTLFLPQSAGNELQKTLMIFRKMNHKNGEFYSLIFRLDAATRIWKSIYRTPSDRELVEEIIEKIRSFNYHGLSSIAEYALSSVHFTSSQSLRSESIEKFEGVNMNFTTQLPFNIIQWATSAHRKLTLEALLQDFAVMLREATGCAAVFFVPTSAIASEKVTIIGDTSIEAAWEFLKNFTDLEHVAVIPLQSPKSIHQLIEKNKEIVKIDFSKTAQISTKRLFYTTTVEPQADHIKPTQEDEEKTSFDSVRKTQVISPGNVSRPKSSSDIGAVIPLAFLGLKLGHLFLDKLGEKFNEKQLEASKELSFAARIFSNLLYLYQSNLPFQQPHLSSLSNFSKLDSCAWLNIWTVGLPLIDENSGWFRGSRLGDDKYLLAHVSLQASNTRSATLARMIWFYLNSWINEFYKNSSEAELTSLEKNLAWLLQNWAGDLSDLTQFSLSISMVDRRDYSVDTFSFGGILSIVLGGDNHQRIFNESVVSINNATKLVHRYGTLASLDSFLPFICAKDPRRMELKLDSMMRGALRSSFRGIEDRFTTPDNLHSIIRRLIGADQVPRYYAGIARKNQSDPQKQ